MKTQRVAPTLVAVLVVPTVVEAVAALQAPPQDPPPKTQYLDAQPIDVQTIEKYRFPPIHWNGHSDHEHAESTSATVEALVFDEWRFWCQSALPGDGIAYEPTADQRVPLRFFGYDFSHGVLRYVDQLPAWDGYGGGSLSSTSRTA